MRKIFFIFICLLFFSVAAHANPTCSYAPNGQSVTSGCPANFSFATQGSSTPVLATNTANYTNPITGVSTTGIYCTYGIPYSTVVGFNAPSGSAQNSQDVTDCYPHECIGSPNTCIVLRCYHDGAFYQHGIAVSGCFGDQTIAQEAILLAQKFLGVPTPVGNKTVIEMVNYRLTAAPAGFGTNNFPVQFGDANCVVAYTSANSSVFPYTKLYELVYGPSAGASFVVWSTLLPSTAYTSDCPTSYPSTVPVFRAVAAWTPFAFYNPVGNSYTFNSVAFQNAVCGLNGQTSCVLATQETNCSALTPSCDPGEAVASGTINTAIKNTQIMFQNGTVDLTVISDWNSNTGGNWYRIPDAFGQSGSGVYPFAELLQNCGHECTIGNIDGFAQIDAFNFLYPVIQNGSSVGGTAAE